MSYSEDIEVVLDRADRTYHAGETVSGNVLVHPEKELHCRLRLQWCWYAVAKDALDDEGQPQSTVLAQELDCAAGERRTFPFSFEAPRSPATYAGSHFTLGWSAVAIAEGSGRHKDPVAGSGFVLKAAPGAYDSCVYDATPLEESGTQLEPETTNPGSKRGAVGCFLVVIVAALVTLAYLVRAILAATDQVTQLTDGMYALFAGGLAVGCALGLRTILRRYATTAAIGHVEVSVPDRAAPGAPLHCRVHLPIQKPIQLKHVLARIEVEERTLARSVNLKSDSSTSHVRGSWTVRKDEHVFAGTPGRQIACDTTLEEDIPIPAELPLSFYAPNNTLHVRLVLHIADQSGRVDWTSRHALLVTPAA